MPVLTLPPNSACDAFQNLQHDVFGAVPLGVGANAFFRAGRELHDDLIEAEIAVDRPDQLVDRHAFVFKLLVGAEDVRVVLGETAHAHQAVQGARGLVAVDAAEFGHPVRQLAVGPQAMLEDLDVAGAVHRLDRELAIVLGRRGEHVLAGTTPSGRRFPKATLSRIWGAFTSR